MFEFKLLHGGIPLEEGLSDDYDNTWALFKIKSLTL